MKPKSLSDTRQRILAAAEGLSCEIGPARVSIEAVAARAGISKGGLLYHFPTKHALLRALVEDHVDDMRLAMEREAPGCRTDPDPRVAARAYLRATRRELGEKVVPPGIFAAIAEDPEFIAPLRAFHAELLTDVFGRCADPTLATVVFLACEGLVHARLTDPHAADLFSQDKVFDRLEDLLASD